MRQTIQGCRNVSISHRILQRSFRCLLRSGDRKWDCDLDGRGLAFAIEITHWVADRVIPEERIPTDDDLRDHRNDLSLWHDVFLLSPLGSEFWSCVIHVKNPDLPRCFPHENSGVEYESATSLRP